MAWVKIDDGFVTHPKAQAAGPLARELFLSGLCWCAAHLTDGQIPKTMVPLLAAQVGVKPALARKLVDVGLWDDEGEHYAVHDFLTYNRSRSQVEAERKRWRGYKSGSTDDSTAESTDDSTAEPLADSAPSRPDPTRSGTCISTTDNREMLANGSSSVVEKAALVFGFAQAASSQKAIDDSAGYARGVARNVLAEQGERLRAYVAEHPSADAEAVAANVFKLDRWALIGARKAMS